MKITKRQLKRIIKEEKAKLLKEASMEYLDGAMQARGKWPINDPSTRAKLFADLSAAVGALLQAGLGPEELAGELYGIGENVEANAMSYLER